jgi:hypothetical protein
MSYGNIRNRPPASSVVMRVMYLSVICVMYRVYGCVLCYACVLYVIMSLSANIYDDESRSILSESICTQYIMECTPLTKSTSKSQLRFKVQAAKRHNHRIFGTGESHWKSPISILCKTNMQQHCVTTSVHNRNLHYLSCPPPRPRPPRSPPRLATACGW